MAKNQNSAADLAPNRALSSAVCVNPVLRVGIGVLVGVSITVGVIVTGPA